MKYPFLLKVNLSHVTILATTNNYSDPGPVKLQMNSILLRSVLYVPGSNPKALAKAPTLGADALILDLEDSVAPEAKRLSRQNVLETLLASEGQCLRIVRINSTQTNLWMDDIQTLLPGRPDAVALSKTETPNDLNGPTNLLEQLEKPHNTPCPLWAMIESPLGVLNAFAIASHPRVTCLVMGTSDLALSLGVPYTPNRIGLRLALQQTILAARAAKLQILDGVFVNLQDMEGFRHECQTGAQLGFDGKTLIHPRQIPTTNQIFLPSAEEVEQARQILHGWQTARAQGEEICVVNGRLVERLHANQAEQQLAKWKLAQKHQ